MAYCKTALRVIQSRKARIRLKVEIEIGLDFDQSKAHIRLEIGIEIRLEFNQSEGRKPISSLVNFALIGQNPIQSQS